MKYLVVMLKKFLKILPVLIGVAVICALYERSELRFGRRGMKAALAGGRCPQRLPPATPWFEWQVPDVGSNQTFVLSAFLEQRDRNRTLLLVIAISSVRDVRHFCRVWSGDLDRQLVVEARGEIHPDSHRKRYTVWTYECDVSGFHRPVYVSIVRSECQPPSYYLVIQNARHPGAPRNHVTVKPAEDGGKVDFIACLPPLNNDYNDHNQLIEWIEVNRLFGIDRFIVYNYTSGPKVRQVLNFYREQGILEIVPWKIPVRVSARPNEDVEIHYYAQTAALNDCFCRSRHLSRFVVNVDVDELIVPRNGSDYLDMLRRSFDESIGADDLRFNNTRLESLTFIALNTFFRSDRRWKFFIEKHQDRTISDLEVEIFRYDARTLSVLTRNEGIFEPGVRSKLLVGTAHFPWLEVHRSDDVSSDVVVIPQRLGLLHHYRNVLWEDKSPQIDDEYMLNFAPEILSRLKDAYEQLKPLQIHPNRPTPALNTTAG